MLRCKSPSSSEHMESSKEESEEASEDEVSLTEASEMSGTEESCSELIGILWVDESLASELSLPRTKEEEEEGREEEEEEGREEEACEAGCWVRE